MKYFFLILSLSILPAGLSAQQDVLPVELPETAGTASEALHVRVKGFVDTYHAVRTEGKVDWMASRTRARGELSLEKSGTSLFISMNATHNGLLKDRTGITLREAYLSYAGRNVDLRAGRQIIVWGVADALRLTDLISPMDYTEFLAQDYDDIRTPVNALRLKYIRPTYSIEVVCIPISDFFTLPLDPANPWSVGRIDSPLPATFDLESGKPARRLSNVEFGGRLAFNLSGIDFSFSALQTWNKMPAFSYALSPDKQSVEVSGNYRRMTMLGGDFSLPAGRFVVRGEEAVLLHEAQNADFGCTTETRNTLNTLLGIDWYGNREWSAGLQYLHKYVAGNLQGLSVLRNSGYATVRISKNLLRNTLALSTFAYIDVTRGGVFNRLSATYSLNDQITLAAGYDFFHADGGMFQMYARNSEAWVKMKYSF